MGRKLCILAIKKGQAIKPNPLIFNTLFGAPGAIRTPDPLVRSQVLYPAELRAHAQHYTSCCIILKELISFFYLFLAES